MTLSIRLALAAAIALTVAGAARASDPHPYPLENAGAPPTRVAFGDFAAINNWKVDHSGALLLRTASDHYYRATFAGPCPELPVAINIGFITEAYGPLDRWSSVYVDGDRCWFKTFDPIDRSVFEGS
jgi:hypothetical protein